MRKITTEYFHRYGQQYYAKKFSDHCHTIRAQEFLDPFKWFQHQEYDYTVDKNTNQNINIKIISL